MRIRYWAPRYWLLLGLLGLGRAGVSQTPLAPTPDDSLKGRIWTTTAQRVWADEKLTQPAIKWATGADFTKWALTQKDDKSELGSLWAAVINRIGKGQTGTPTQVAQAILAEITQRKERKFGALMKVNTEALHTALAKFVQAPSGAPAATGPADSAVLAAPASTPPTVAEDPNPAPELRAVPMAPAAVAPEVPRYFGLPPYLAGAALALLGALAGAWLMNYKAHKDRIARHQRAAQKAAETHNKLHQMTAEESALLKENRDLKAQIQQLKQEVAALQAQLSPASAPLAAEEDALFEVKLTEPAGQQAVATEPAPPQPPATRYGPVQETPFVEERKIVDSPLPQLALMLTVNPRTPDQATFTLNPQVDQARLIGDGLTRLQKFFDYDPPIGGRITAVAAVKAGKLQRQDTGWQVVERAQLLIS